MAIKALPGSGRAKEGRQKPCALMQMRLRRHCSICECGRYNVASLSISSLLRHHSKVLRLWSFASHLGREQITSIPLPTNTDRVPCWSGGDTFAVFTEKLNIAGFGTKERSRYSSRCIFGALFRIVSYPETGVKCFITIYVINCGQISGVIDTIGCHRLGDDNRSIESRCEFFASGRCRCRGKLQAWGMRWAECGRHFLHYHAFSFCGDNYSASVCMRRALPAAASPRLAPAHPRPQFLRDRYVPGPWECIERPGCILDQITFASEYFITALLLALHCTVGGWSKL